jgi:hypothetical protein
VNLQIVAKKAQPNPKNIVLRKKTSDIKYLPVYSNLLKIEVNIISKYPMPVIIKKWVWIAMEIMGWEQVARGKSVLR